MLISFNKEYEDYLKDESRKTGEAEYIEFPSNEDEICAVLKSANEKGISVTIQGARTGITGGAVPNGGYILNMSGMNRITGLRYDDENDSFFLSVQPGVLLSQIRNILSNLEFDTNDWSDQSKSALNMLKGSAPRFFSPDPTETSASIGGMIACNASGARSFYYGAVRKYIEAIRVILAGGTILDLKRGIQKAENRLFRLQSESGRVIEGKLPDYKLPDVKNAAGYFAEDNMDIIDLFIGAEGTLGVITDIQLRLLKSPSVIWGAMSFFSSEEIAIRYVSLLRERLVKNHYRSSTSIPVSIEYFNHNALQLVREYKSSNMVGGDIPSIPKEFHTAIYVELHGDNEDAVGDMLLEASELISLCGGNDEATWIACNEKEMTRLHTIRHVVPEAVNALIDKRRKNNQQLTKLGTDMAVPDNQLENIIELYNSKLNEAGLESVMFGHIGNNHIHVNILPNNMEEYNRGRQLYLDWAREVIGMGGTVSAEHGIGKLKIEVLKEMYGEAGIAQMYNVKMLFDSGFILNRGNLFEVREDCNGG